MPFQDYSKRWVWAPLLVSLLLLLGFGAGVLSNRYFTKKKSITNYIDRQDPIDEIITLIDQQYVDSVDRDSLYTDAVKGILTHLDPHTVYIPSFKLATANEQLEGGGKGLGLEYYLLNDTVTITKLIEGGPAARQGLKLGDRIISINNKPVSGIAITNEELTRRVQNQNHDTLLLALGRGRPAINLRLTIIKGVYERNSVSAAYLMEDGRTGFIKLNTFTANCYDEFTSALQSLKDRGMTQLIFDLRGNPGGYLSEAISIADELLDNDKLIVFTQGRTMPKETYEATMPGIFEKGRLVILVDENSASASEIVAGAVQDWDRGVLIGRTTFGKGLVQEQFELSDGSAMRITTARYYTPSGRSIQRPYAKGKAAYDQAYYDRLGQPLAMDANHPDNAQKFETNNKRSIYAKGGIEPDLLVADNLQPSTAAFKTMEKDEILDKAIYAYYFNRVAPYRTFGAYSNFTKTFVVNDSVLKFLKEPYLKQDAIAARVIFTNPQDLNYIKVRTKALIAQIIYGKNGFFKVVNTEDNVVKTATRVLGNTEFSEIIKDKKTLSLRKINKFKVQSKNGNS